MQSPSKHSGLSRIRTLAAAAIGAAAGGLLWGAVEVRALVSSDVSLSDAALAVAAAVLLVTFVCLLPGAIAGWLWQDPRAGGALRSYFDKRGAVAAAELASLCLAFFGVGYASFFALEIFAASFASAQVRAIAIGGVAPFLALAGFGVYRLLRSALARVAERKRWKPYHTTMLIAGIALVGLGWAASFFVLAPHVYEELRPLRFTPYLVSMAGAVVGGMWLRGRAMVALTPAVAVVALLGAAHFATGSSNKLNQAVEQETEATRAMLGVLDSLQRDSGPAERREVEGAATCFPGVSAPAADSIGKISEDAPNIVLLTVDAMRWDRTNLSGYKRETTPNLVEHAADAAVFENAYTPATSTRQTFRSLFSGVHPAQVAAPKGTTWGVSFAEEQETLASYLSAAGYRTIAVVSDPGAFPEEYGALEGFEVIDASAEGFHKEYGYSAPYKVDRLVAHLIEQGDDRPVFIWTHVREAHQPHKRGPDPVDYGKAPSDRYDSSLHFVDGELDRMLRFVKSPHWRQNTYLFLSADHGHAFKEHGHRSHGTAAHQEQSRVPLLAWGPDVEPGRHKRAVSLLDVMPTLFDLVGLEPIKALCGESLMQSLDEAKPPPERPVYVEQLPDSTRDYFSISFVSGRYALVYGPTSGVVELYDMKKDPAQEKNLADERPEQVESMVEELHAFYKRRGFDVEPYRLDRL